MHRTFGDADGSFHGFHYVYDRDLRWLTRQQIAAVGASSRLKQTCRTKQLQNLAYGRLLQIALARQISRASWAAYQRIELALGAKDVALMQPNSR